MELGTIAKIEIVMRICAILLLVMTACLVGLDSQTKYIIYFEKTVTYNDLKALLALMYMDSAAAVYNLFQLSRCFFAARYKGHLTGSYRYLAWCCYVLDQMAAYITFATTSAATEHSALVITGVTDFQWMKWCHKFTRFCVQIGGALFCGYVACALMALLSFISAFNLFRLYSPKNFMVLKST